jgi:hypothetical protein
MPGPAPKPAALRQRRNKDVTQAALINRDAPLAKVPPLPKRKDGWHKLTKAWWKDIWQSPMHVEFLRADVHALFRLAVLIDLFWTEPNLAVAAEIRLQQQAFGLTPLDRRRLQWQVIQTEGATDKYERERSRRATPIGDAREILR